MKNVALRSCQSYEYNEVSKQFEKLIKLDKGYSKYEIADIAFDMRNINTKWIWLDTFSETQISEFKEAIKNNSIE